MQKIKYLFWCAVLLLISGLYLMEKDTPISKLIHQSSTGNVTEWYSESVSPKWEDETPGETTNGEVRVNSEELCPVRVAHLSDQALPLVALASFPRSGNTWTRFIIEQLSGIATGSVYCSPFLKKHDFPLECNKKNVLVIKTHKSQFFPRYEKAVLLIRNPYASIYSYFHLLYSRSHTKNAKMNKFEEYFESFARTKITAWENFYYFWLKQFSGPIHLVIYEELRRRLRSGLQQIGDFLRVNYTETDMACTIENEGKIFRRKTSDITMQSVYDNETVRLMNKAMNNITTVLRRRFPEHSDFRFSPLDELE